MPLPPTLASMEGGTRARRSQIRSAAPAVAQAAPDGARFHVCGHGAGVLRNWRDRPESNRDHSRTTVGVADSGTSVTVGIGKPRLDAALHHSVLLPAYGRLE